MEIQVDPHTLERAEERGANEKEIKDVINTGFPLPAKYGRMGKAKVYDFNRSGTANIMSKREWKCSTPLKGMLS